MHTVCETKAFARAAAEGGLGRDDVDAITVPVAASLEIGDVIQGTGGCRKLRFGGRGRGKSDGFRIITFFTGPRLPVFLITVFGKGEKANLTPRERNELAAVTATLAGTYRKRQIPAGDRR